MENLKTERGQGHFDMEVLVGYILLVGVLLSVLLLIIGLIWHWASKGELGLVYPIEDRNLFGFLLHLTEQIFSGAFHPKFLISVGMAVLLLTPFVRVIASMFYFAVALHNWKYTAFTGFVTAVLTYSLFLR